MSLETDSESCKIVNKQPGVVPIGSKDGLAGGHVWVSEGIQPSWAGQGWRIYRHNRTTGKSGGAIVASNLGEYIAKTMTKIVATR